MGTTSDRVKKPRANTPAKTGTRARAASAGRKTITFKIHAPEATTVDIAGTFTTWNLKPLKRGKDGIWKATFRPQPGVYEYKFLIDHQWVADPENHDKADDGHGGFNSVCRVE